MNKSYDPDGNGLHSDLQAGAYMYAIVGGSHPFYASTFITGVQDEKDAHRTYYYYSDINKLHVWDNTMENDRWQSPLEADGSRLYRIDAWAFDQHGEPNLDSTYLKVLDSDGDTPQIPSCSDQGGGTCASSTYCTDIIPSRDNPKCCLPENCQPKTADFNCNDYVDIYDFGILMSCWGYYNPSCAAQARGSCTNYPDINQDDDVGSSEFAAIMSQWGQ